MKEIRRMLTDPWYLLNKTIEAGTVIGIWELYRWQVLERWAF